MLEAYIHRLNRQGKYTIRITFKTKYNLVIRQTTYILDEP